MIILLHALLLFTFEPADSAWALVTLGEVPERALLFAELAARDGGQAVTDLGLLMEAAGRFNEARDYYTIASATAEDTRTVDWLGTRILGTIPLDTLVFLTVVVSNDGPSPAYDLRVEVPLPVPHPPYQELDLLRWGFDVDDDRLSLTINTLCAGESALLPLAVRIRQLPYSYRPIPDHLPDNGMPLEQLAEMVRSSPIAGDTSGPGPCLETASILAEIALEVGLELQITGGLLRSPSGDLVFHAWNTIPSSWMPVDRVLFDVDSLRGLGHAATDLVPLWDLGSADGHEVTLYYPDDGSTLRVDMVVDYADMDILEAVLHVLPSVVPVPTALRPA